MSDPLSDFHRQLLFQLQKSKQLQHLSVLQADFSLLDQVQAGKYIEDILQNSTDLGLPSSYPVIPKINYSNTARFELSLNQIIDKVFFLLRMKPQTRDNLALNANLDRRRVSSALSPLSAVNLIVEPEALRIGTNGKMIVKIRMPGVRLYRHYRQEAAVCQINMWIEYYLCLKKVRTQIAEIIAQHGGLALEPDNRFVGRRIDEVAKKRLFE
ncbi:Conserved_hypothetical protein [Hexamita inflata]|uniref:Uncharacterized protein n=1 Tax=Hexamita inflata TaxID=28002 RepID=A0AA86RNQ1_9EUKA|nr:Conserved hypothetical protein [Hexamita inflata]